MATKNHEEVLYAIEVHGYAPEFWPAVAFRRTGGKEKKQPQAKERQKEIKCPYCGKHFMQVSEKRRLDLVRFNSRVKAKCHEYRKCKICSTGLATPALRRVWKPSPPRVSCQLVPLRDF